MNAQYSRLAQHLFLPAICLPLIVVPACTSNSGSTTGRTSAAAASDSAGSHVDVMCISDRIEKPPGPFHYSYKYSDASGSTNKEAEITPQAMDITINDKSGSHSFHGIRSDEASWNSAVLDLSNLNITAMASRLDALNDTSAIVRQATESLNGYDTTRYAIDSASANAGDQRTFQELFGNGAFEKGTVWIGSDGCAVKLVLDERVLISNKPKDAHYEIARLKK